jgi:hypothetical protein
MAEQGWRGLLSIGELSAAFADPKSGSSPAQSWR